MKCNALVFNFQESTFTLPTDDLPNQTTHITSFVKSKKTVTNNEENPKGFTTFEFEEFEDFGDRSHGIGTIVQGIVKNIRNNRQENDKMKRETEENDIKENEVYTPPGHHLNTAQEIAKHHIFQKEHPHTQPTHQVHHEEPDHMIETEEDRTGVTESVGFRVLEFFGTIAGLAWGLMTNVMKFVASGSSAAFGASSSGSS